MSSENVIHAAPTKEFFIQMLTRDIRLERAIIDLLDNCIDGAKKIRPDEDFKGLYIDIRIQGDYIIIKDNCGGFSLDTAKNYAFMFGRPVKAKNNVKNSVGRFGVGMKRALFKIGGQFEVESKHKRDHFQVVENVEKWRKSPEQWQFSYEINSKANSDLKEDGTYIKITTLHPDVKAEFITDSFKSNLKAEIERTLNFFLSKGIEIRLNGQPLKSKEVLFLESKNLKPFYEDFSLKGVTVKVYAGIGEASPDLAGWYIYCNDRLVLERDKTNLTGWEGRRFGESSVQKFHHIYAMFRGAVFFYSEDASLLPMTTTKTGVDANSAVYRAAKGVMINAMQQVIAFLKTFNSDEERGDVITSAKPLDVISLSLKVYENIFRAPSIVRVGDTDESTTVSFQARKDIVVTLKKFFNVSSNRECGEMLLAHFLRMEKDNL